MTAKKTTLTSLRGALLHTAFAASAALLAACAGGSGSSGFLSESAVIQSVLDEARCMDLDGLEICPAETVPTATTAPTETPTAAPSDTSPVPQSTPTASFAVPQGTTTATPEGTPPFPPGTPTATPTGEAFTTQTPLPTATARATSTANATPTYSPRPSASPTATTIPGSGIDILRPPTLSGDCAPLADTGACLALALRARGFPLGSAFYLATRAADSDGMWQLTAASFDFDTPASGALDALVPLRPNSDAGNGLTTLQIVVLVFFDDPSPLPASVHRLADSGADQAFALAPVSF